MMEWVEKQPIIDQPDIMREFKSLVEERLAQNGITDFDFEDLEAQIAVYEEAVLTEKLAEAQLIMEQQELDKKMLEINAATVGVRRYVIDCIINKEENAEAMTELATKLIAAEKETGVYDHNNWKEIL